MADQNDLNDRVRAASLIATLQAAYTDFHYLRPIWKRTTEKDALIGVSMTGIASNKVSNLNLVEAASIVKEENARVASIIGINKSARMTCVKPAGCQDKNTMISTQDGILHLHEIGDITGSQWQTANFGVYTDSTPQTASNFYVNGWSATKKIKLDSGLILESTPNHKYKIFDGEGCVWKSADCIIVGDKILYSVGEYCGGNYQKLIPTQYKSVPNLKDINFPSILDESLAWFIGIYYGDGSNHKKGIRIHGDKRKQKGFDQVKRTVLDKFNINTKYYEKLTSNKCELHINSTLIVQFLEENGISKNKSKDLEFPIIIRKSPRSVIEAFIDGYYCADGCDLNLCKTSCTVSKKFADQLTVVLRAIGRDSKMRDMPPTASSWGTNMRYWVSERKGRHADRNKLRRDRREVFDKLDSIGYKNLSFDTVIDVCDSENFTFDIEVDSDDHSYIGNSYISHNTTSTVLGCSSGIHAWHNDYYIRRIRVGKNEAIYTYLSINHPELIEDEYFRPHDTAVISIPQAAPVGAILRSESETDFIERIKKFNIDWVQSGHVDGDNFHNVSATVSVTDWDNVGELVWKNKDSFSGLSFLPHSDHTYKQAPFEDIDKSEFDRLFSTLKNVDLTKVIEIDDNTNLAGELACAGGVCEIK